MRFIISCPSDQKEGRGKGRPKPGEAGSDAADDPLRLTNRSQSGNPPQQARRQRPRADDPDRGATATE